VHAQIGRDGSSLRARIYLADENGHIRGSRELSAPVEECQNLVAAVALAISIAIDPMSVSAPSPMQDRASIDDEVAPQARADRAVAQLELPASSEAQAAAAGERRDAGVAQASQRAPTQSPSQWYAGMGTHLSSGTAPSLAVGLSAFARLNLADVSLGLEGRYDFPASADAPEGPGVVSSALLLASLEPCARASPLYFCGLLSIGSLRAAGAGVAVPFEQSTMYWGAGGRVAFEVAVVAPMLLRAHLDVVSNVTRTTLAIRGSDVWQTPPVAAAAGISMVAHVW
jgi:hypothetical protein